MAALIWRFLDMHYRNNSTSSYTTQAQSKDIDAVESQRLERIQAARRIKRVKSTNSRRSYSADSRNEDGGGGSSCLPTCLRGQRRSDKDRLYRSRQESSCSDFPSPDSNPPSYDGACRGRPRCNSGIEENAALLVDVTSSSHRSHSDKGMLYRSRQESSCSDFPSPDSNPPSYDGACRGRPRCNSGIEENAALLVDVTSSSHRS
ncbi:hypothetical protein EGW08_012636 [Elysia chlorotica]|uniref:Uncharacterized protein n=1 Tax=Elysia chlorotica TaxID=188477 RepID=A0A3S1B4F4_ELYCH|nr:hypothetical protein EGW08_012636 [Elysia chlorotica]